MSGQALYSPESTAAMFSGAAQGGRFQVSNVDVVAPLHVYFESLISLNQASTDLTLAHVCLL